MKTHALARRLLAGPDVEVSLSVHGHVYQSEMDKTSHGPLKVSTMTARWTSGETKRVISRRAVSSRTTTPSTAVRRTLTTAPPITRCARRYLAGPRHVCTGGRLCKGDCRGGQRIDGVY